MLNSLQKGLKMASRLSFFILGANPFLQYESSILLKTGSLPSPEMRQAFCDQVKMDCRVTRVAAGILSLASEAFLTNSSYSFMCLIAGATIFVLASLRIRQIEQLRHKTVNKATLPIFCEAFEKQVNDGGKESLQLFFSPSNPWNRAFPLSARLEPSSENNERRKYFEHLRDRWGLIKVFKEMIARNQGNVAARVPEQVDEVNGRLKKIEVTLQEIEKRFLDLCKNSFKNFDLTCIDRVQCDSSLNDLSASWQKIIPWGLRFIQ
jgi:hypothetical protein